MPADSLVSFVRPVALLAATALVAACGGKGPAPANAATRPDSATARSAGPRDARVVVLDSTLARLVLLGVPDTVPVADELRIAGRLEVDGYRTARIGAPVTGRVTDVRAVLGQEVREGQALAHLTSQEVTAAQLAFLKAHAAEQLAQRAAERADTLFAADVIAAAELQRRRSELAVAKAETRSSADQLAILGIGAADRERIRRTGQIVAEAPVVATRGGTVIERRLAPGQVVQPADSLFVVSDLSRLWGVAAVPEQRVRDVRMGQAVRIEIPAAGATAVRTGTVVFVADVVDPGTHTVRVGVVLENPGRVLKPQMLMTMVVPQPVAARAVVPASAVVRVEGADHLFVRTAPGTVTLVPARLGPDVNGRRAVLDPLPGDGTLVVDGAFHLDTERQRRALEGGK